MNWCTYFTHHPTSGWFYVGKGKTRDVLSGAYSGSGTKLANVRKKYPKHQWVTEVMWTFDTSEEALSDEAGINIEELMRDPKCCNLVQGGRGGRSCTHTENTKEAIRVKLCSYYAVISNRLKTGECTKAAMALPEVRSRFEAGMATRRSQKGIFRPQSVKDKVAKKLTGVKHTPERRQHQSEAVAFKPKASCVYCRRVMPTSNIPRHFNKCRIK